MAGLEKTTVHKLPTAERDELEQLLATQRKGGDRFHSHLLDAVTWWLFLLVLSAVGLVASVVTLVEDGGEAQQYLFETMTYDLPMSLFYTFQGSPHIPGLFVAIGIAAWTSIVWIRNLKGRGAAITTFGLMRLMHPKVLLMRHRDVAKLEHHTVRVRNRSPFTVLDVTGEDGKLLRFYVTRGWTDAAIAQVAQARAAAGLPAVAAVET